MAALDYYPKREGYCLTEEGEQAWENWCDDYYRHCGCTCWISAPCSICCHKNHPYGIEETDEYWVKEEEEMSRDKIIDKSKEKSVEYKVGDKVRIIGNTSSHKYELGDIVTLVGDKENYSGGWYWDTNDKKGCSCVLECDIEPYYGITGTIQKVTDGEWKVTDGIHPTIKITPVIPEKGVEIKFKRTIDWLTYEFKNETNQQTKGDLNMSNTQRRVISVILIDPDVALPVEDSQVHDFGQIVTEDDDSTTIQELIMNNDMLEILAVHNGKRTDHIDLEIQKKTGNTVNLQPVKLKQLKWIIK